MNKKRIAAAEKRRSAILLELFAKDPHAARDGKQRLAIIQEAVRLASEEFPDVYGSLEYQSIVAYVNKLFAQCDFKESADGALEVTLPISEAVSTVQRLRREARIQEKRKPS